MGKKLGGGGFGMVYKADLITEEGETIDAVVKKAKEFGEAEVWMNERLMRLPKRCCAEFITAFEEGPPFYLPIKLFFQNPKCHNHGKKERQIWFLAEI